MALLYTQELSLIEEELLKHLDPEVRYVFEVGNYILSSGGKRIRPLLTLLTCKVLGGKEEIALPLAVGIEYVHVASLLHDDVVDNAQTRRGKKSANLVFGEKACVLTGDYMYAKALSLYSEYGSIESIRVLSDAVMKMSQGQVLELINLGKLIDEETYFKVIDYKTGALFGACLAVGALCANRTDYWRFYSVGIKLGRAFQLIDDALDYVGDEKKLGKPAGNDLREGKCTYPLISLLDKLSQKELKLFYEKPEELRKTVVELGGVERTKQRARQELQEVINFFEGLEGSDALRELFFSVVEREA
ncbi:MAG: polyprenyl synthetase family protein [Aquificota bacterium]|nr:MAG: polyprenyl synthetase family protein [Aquificota bacterium]